MGLDEGLRQSMCSEQGAGSRTEPQVCIPGAEGPEEESPAKESKQETSVAEGGPTEQSDRMQLRCPVT